MSTSLDIPQSAISSHTITAMLEAKASAVDEYWCLRLQSIIVS